MPHYQIQLHTTAERELNDLPQSDRDALTSALRDVAERRQPTQHTSVKHLEGQPGLWRVRAGNARAICTLQKPSVIVLRCGPRESVYDDVDSVHERLTA